MCVVMVMCVMIICVMMTCVLIAMCYDDVRADYVCDYVCMVYVMLAAV